jgi:hypothetical protein
LVAPTGDGRGTSTAVSLSLQVKVPNSKSLLGSDFVPSADDEFKSQLSQLDQGASITVCGRFTSYTRFTGLMGDLVAGGACPNATVTGG